MIVENEENQSDLHKNKSPIIRPQDSSRSAELIILRYEPDEDEVIKKAICSEKNLQREKVIDEFDQSASKHGRCTFPYSSMRELVCNGQLWARATSQLQGRIARAFYMDMTAVIQYILTAAQSLGSQVYYKRSRMTILELAGVLFWKTSRHIQNGVSYVPKKILTWMLREARGGLKATVGNRVNLIITLSAWFFVLFCFFQPDSCVPWQGMLKSVSAHIGHCGPKPG